MLRRRRPRTKEIAFSFDSFLDLVANVVGIILRLILVAWVGARTYTGVYKPPANSAAGEMTEPAAALAEPSPSTAAEKTAVEQAREKLADARAALLEHLRQQDDLRSRRQQIDREAAGGAR